MAEGLKDRDRMRVNYDGKFEKIRIEPPRFIVYVDGYNFYAAINHSEPRDLLRLGWCNFQKLGEKLVSLTFDLEGSSSPQVVVKYFTSLVSHQDNTAGGGEERRQKLWLEALKDETKIEPILGRHVPRQEGRRKEKWTDVNISITMIRDIADRPNGMILISGDHDFQPVVEAVAELKIPVAVFNPHGYEMYAPRLGTSHGRRIRTSYLTQEVLKGCRLQDQKRWEEYLDLKIKSTTPKDRKAQSPFQVCREFEDKHR